MTPACVRIESYSHRSFHESGDTPPQTAWLPSFYEGLLRQFNLPTNAQQLDRGKNNHFLKMGRVVLQDLQARSALGDVALFLMAQHSIDLYYPLQSTTTVLCREFGISAPALAFCETGLTATYVALKTLIAALRKKGADSSALLLALDHATQPCGDFAGCVDNAFALKVTLDKHDQGLVLDDAHRWIGAADDKPAMLKACITRLVTLHGLDWSDIDICTEPNVATLLEACLSADSLHLADRRFMSCAGLLRSTELLNSGAQNVLLAHLSDDGHLFLFLFMKRGAATGPAHFEEAHNAC